MQYEPPQALAAFALSAATAAKAIAPHATAIVAIDLIAALLAISGRSSRIVGAGGGCKAEEARGRVKSVRLPVRPRTGLSSFETRAMRAPQDEE
jgi:hypothetical protein